MVFSACLSCSTHWSGFWHIFEKHFSYIFNTFSVLNEKNLMPSIIFTFPKFDLWNTTQKNICKTAICGKKQNMNKPMAEFRTSLLQSGFQRGKVLKVLTKYWISKSVFNTLNVLKSAKICVTYWKSMEILNEKEIWSVWAEFYWRQSISSFMQCYALCNVQNWVSWLRISKNKKKLWYWTFLI